MGNVINVTPLIIFAISVVRKGIQDVFYQMVLRFVCHVSNAAHAREVSKMPAIGDGSMKIGFIANNVNKKSF
tara:strand:+ start:3363 stop:3578 length:216 start_codon:yes stop_codon:yes gene_type:complete